MTLVERDAARRTERRTTMSIAGSIPGFRRRVSRTRCWVGLDGFWWTKRRTSCATARGRGVHEVPIVFGAGALEGERMLLSRRLVAEAELRRIVAASPGSRCSSVTRSPACRCATAGAVPVVTGVDLRSGASVDGGSRSSMPAAGARRCPTGSPRSGFAHRSTSGRTAGSSISLGTTGCDRGVRHRRAGSRPRSPSTTHQCSRSVRTTTRSR